MCCEELYFYTLKIIIIIIGGGGTVCMYLCMSVCVCVSVYVCRQVQVVFPWRLEDLLLGVDFLLLPSENKIRLSDLQVNYLLKYLIYL